MVNGLSARFNERFFKNSGGEKENEDRSGLDYDFFSKQDPFRDCFSALRRFDNVFSPFIVPYRKEFEF